MLSTACSNREMVIDLLKQLLVAVGVVEEIEVVGEIVVVEGTEVVVEIEVAEAVVGSIQVSRAVGWALVEVVMKHHLPYSLPMVVVVEKVAQVAVEERQCWGRTVMEVQQVRVESKMLVSLDSRRKRGNSAVGLEKMEILVSEPETLGSPVVLVEMLELEKQLQQGRSELQQGRQESLLLEELEQWE